MRNIDKIIIHCSATIEGVNVSTSTIKRWHVQGRGWSDIGYHYVIGLDGAIDYGRPISRSGAHTLGHNKSSIGIAYIGGLSESKRAKDTRTEAQKKALIKILKTLTHIYPKASIHGHREFSKDLDGDGVEKHEWFKSCPCYEAELEAYELGLQPKSFKPLSKKTKDKLKKK